MFDLVILMQRKVTFITCRCMPFVYQVVVYLEGLCVSMYTHLTLQALPVPHYLFTASSQLQACFQCERLLKCTTCAFVVSLEVLQ